VRTALGVNQENHPAQTKRVHQHLLVVRHDPAANLALHSAPRRSEVSRYGKDDEPHSRHRILHQGLQVESWDGCVHCCKDIGASAVLQEARWATEDLLANARTTPPLVGYKYLQRLSHHLDDAIPEKSERLPTLGKVSAAYLPNTACETSNLQAMYFKRAQEG